ncbi:MAG TPA: DUF3617 family protein [Steroidobacteraceae bacterium]|nr:DUF3617 family protein [Steroidobacteraceae bacterium]
MRMLTQVRILAAAASLAVLGTQPVAQADDKPTGELWRQTTSMQMAGMAMPARTFEVCVPPGKADEALSKPQGPGMGDNCSLQDAKREGNRFTAKFICTGKQPMQGTVESIFEGDHTRTTMTMSMGGQSMVMKTDSQKLGTPCTPKFVPGGR